jgi:Ca2+-binding EF-hand superfamily protein
MNRKLWLVTATVLAMSFCSRAGAQGPGGPEQADPGAAGETKPAAKPRIRWPKALKLPDQYRSRDVDKDGQIGMYEWPRSDFATFRKLDLNHDGFLTPQELTPTLSGKLAAPVVSVSQYPPDAAASESPASKSSSAAPETADAPPVPVNGQRSEADRFFDLLDKDKNDKVTEEEFKKSFSMPKKFADAGISLSFPVTRDEFARQYPQPAAK